MLSLQHNSVQLFKLCAGAKMIKPILVMLCDMSGWWFFNIVQSSLLSSSPFHLKKKASHVLDRCFSDGSVLIDIHEMLTMIAPVNSKRLVCKIPPTRRNSCIACGTCVRGITCGICMKVRLIDSFKFICSARSMGMFSSSRFESFISILSHPKSVNSQGTKLDGINVPKYGSMVTKYFSSHSQNERQGLCHQDISLSVDDNACMRASKGLIFWVTIMSLCSTINHFCTLD